MAIHDKSELILVKERSYKCQTPELLIPTYLYTVYPISRSIFFSIDSIDVLKYT